MTRLPLSYKYLVSIYIRLGLVDKKSPDGCRGFFAKSSFRFFPAFPQGYFAYPPQENRPDNQKT